MCFVAGRILDPVLLLVRFWWHFFDLLGCFWASCWYLLLPFGSFGAFWWHFSPHLGHLGDTLGVILAPLVTCVASFLVAFWGLLGSSCGHFWRHWGDLGRHGRPKSKNRPGSPKFGPHFGMILGRFGRVKTIPENHQKTDVQKAPKKWSHSSAVWTKQR